jgi:hypothetical protein
MKEYVTLAEALSGSLSLTEALNRIPYGLCSICDAEHTWNNVKCDLLFWEIPKEESNE